MGCTSLLLNSRALLGLGLVVQRHLGLHARVNSDACKAESGWWGDGSAARLSAQQGTCRGTTGFWTKQITLYTFLGQPAVQKKSHRKIL